MQYIHRAAEHKFQAYGDFFNVVLVTGPRQVGKTTMLQHLAANTGRSYASPDDPLVRRLAADDPAGFFHSYPPPVLIGEVQYAPQLFPVIKLLADADNTPGRFWLTGSQHCMMLRGVQESLAGPIGILQSGLTQSEKAGTPFEELDLELPALLRRASGRKYVGAGRTAQHIWRGGLPGALPGQDQLL